MAIRKGFYASAAIALIATFGLAYFMMGGEKGAELKTTELVTTQDIQQKRRDDVVESAVELAIVQSAEVLISRHHRDELERRGGVGAVLRF